MAERATPRWLDVFWLFFLGGLALLPPWREIHKDATLLLLCIFQLLETRFIEATGKWGRYGAVAIKIGLAAFLIGHTGDIAAISSSYWPIFWIPVVTAATYFGPLGTLAWTAITSAAYCAYLIPALQQFEITEESVGELLLRITFLFFVGMIVNRFSMENREQLQRYQRVSETLSEANRNLKLAQDEARRAERLAALGQLSAGLAHEIRNPLGVIKGSAELLTQKLGEGEGIPRELAGYIYTEVNRVSALVGRFLDFARPLQLDLHAEDLTQVMDRSLKAVAQQGVLAKVQVHTDYETGLPPAMIDPALCEQAFTNLIANACEAMGDQGGELWARIQRAEKDRSQVVVEIEDSGPGVPDDLKEQIFNPFFTTKKSGVGLGLAIVSKIVDAHGGTVTLCNYGRGACFRITLPTDSKAITAATQGH